MNKKGILVALVSLLLLSVVFSGCVEEQEPTGDDNSNSNSNNQAYTDQTFLSWLYSTRNELQSNKNQIDDALDDVDLDPSPAEGIENKESYETIHTFALDHHDIAGQGLNDIIDRPYLSYDYRAVRDEFEAYLRAEESYGDFLSRWALEIMYYGGTDKDAYLKIANQEENKAIVYWNGCTDLINNLTGI